MVGSKLNIPFLLSFILVTTVAFHSRIEAASSKFERNVLAVMEKYDPPQDCSDILRRHPESESGIYGINVGSDLRTLKMVEVWCDMETDGGGWTVFQRRRGGHVNFYRNYQSYADGFGDVRSEFWLGNDSLFYMTSRRNYELRFDLEDFDGDNRYAKYSQFSVLSGCDGYQLNVRGYQGDAGDSFSPHNGMKFSTYDKDQDIYAKVNCAKLYHGAWWHQHCHSSNLNGLYHLGPHKSYADGVNWYHFRGFHYSLKFTEMKIRPRLLTCY